MTIARMDPNLIRFLTIHCAATPEGKAFSAAQITAMDMQRFNQPSYHHVVELDGRTTQTLRDDQRGAHVAGHNTGNIGVCYIGGVARTPAGLWAPKDTRTESQKMALRAIVKVYRARFPNLIVRGHRDWSPDLDGDGIIEPHEWIKSCPCFDVMTQL